MWLRLGRWVALGVHFGTQNRRTEAPDRYLVHASVRFGKSEWYHGPDRPDMTGDLNAQHKRTPHSRMDLYPDPEPLSWGIRKVTTAATDGRVGDKQGMVGTSIQNG
jgi:hypothetical protein